MINLKHYIEIIIVDSKEYAKASDIGRILNIINIRTSITKFNENEMIKFMSKDKRGSLQNSTFLSEKGVKRLLCESRKCLSIELAMEFGLSLETKYISLETEFVYKFRKVFKGEEIIDQYKVDIYAIDIYLPEYKLAIEYDEDRHKFQQEEDKLRQEFINKKLDCKFIRIDEDTCEYKAFNKIFKHIKNFISESAE